MIKRNWTGLLGLRSQATRSKESGRRRRRALLRRRIAPECLEDRRLLAANYGAEPREILSPILTELSAEYVNRDWNESFNPSNPWLRVVDDRVLLDLLVTDGNNIGDVVADLEGMSFQSTGQFGNAISGYFPIARLSELNQLGAIAVQPSMSTTFAGATTSQGDIAMNTDLVRALLGFDGTGITVGVLSDTFNNPASPQATDLADDIASGDLPSTTTILDEGDTPGIDEGRAMAQLIFDAAPGVDILFHTASDGIASFAQGIVDLANSGADVIVDDMLYFTEPMFQDGPIAQAVDQVVAGRCGLLLSGWRQLPGLVGRPEWVR